ncbi:YraN family protein [Paenibacillus sp. M1]|uniref:UPF0102 protein V3851_05280 n=1 Tax=Paenibacillus haidiansis TaxID=1574488 RepID=A0ABU7VNA7_9BACL
MNKNKSLTDGRKELGRKAEQAACDYLQAQGYTLLERNWSCRSGEIDLIAFCEDTIVIVEVRSRSRKAAAFGTPEESVTARKIKQVRDTAAVYLHLSGQSEANVRFDVIAVTYGAAGELDINHIEAAF